MHTKHKKFHIIRNMHVYNIHTLQYNNIIIVILSIAVKKLSRNHHIVELDAHTIGNKAVYAPNRARLENSKYMISVERFSTSGRCNTLLL